MCAGLVGTATSNGLLALRKKLDPSYSSPVSAAGWVWYTSWASAWPLLAPAQDAGWRAASLAMAARPEPAAAL